MIPNTIKNTVGRIIKRKDVVLLGRFSLVDRFIVFLMFTVNLMIGIALLPEHLTDAEEAELTQPILFGEGVFDIIGWMLLLFLFYPGIALLVTWAWRVVLIGVRSQTRLGAEDTDV